MSALGHRSFNLLGVDADVFLLFSRAKEAVEKLTGDKVTAKH